MQLPDVGQFKAVWRTLGLAGRELPFDATITPEMLARESAGVDRTVRAGESGDVDTTVPEAKRRLDAGISLATLPRLSIEDTTPTGSAKEGLGSDISIIGVLGEGGMGRVLLARQRSLARDVAVKTVRAELTGSVHAAALVSEGLITGHLEHPNITPIHQLGLDQGGRPLLVMKRIAGTAWRELIDDPDHPAWARIPTLPSDRLRAHLEILMQVCNGLSFAHSRSVIHRDVKPDNVMIGEFGEVYVCDWGIAVKLPIGKESRSLVGTPSYLAPEMLDRESEVGSSVDVYLLGGTLHTILTGHPRHEGDSLEHVLESAYASEPVAYPPSVDPELAELANRATSRDPARRPASALAFRREIADYLSHRTSVALSDAASELLEKLSTSLLDPSHDRAEASRLATECHFGFVQAKREWSQNPAAERGLEALLQASLQIELERENLSAARTLLAEMRAPTEDLTARVDALAATLAQRSADSDKLKELRFEGDLSVASKSRTRLFMILLGVGVLMAATATGIRLAGGDPDTPGGHFVFISIIFGSALIGTVVWRRDLLSNKVNRQTAAVLIGSMSLEWLHAVEGYFSRERMVDMHRSEMIVVAAAVGIAGVAITRRWLIPSAILLAGSVIVTFFPSITVPIYVLGHMSILAVLAIRTEGSTP